MAQEKTVWNYVKCKLTIREEGEGQCSIEFSWLEKLTQPIQIKAVNAMQ